MEEELEYCDYCNYAMEWLDTCEWCGKKYCEYCGVQGEHICNNCKEESE